MRQSSTTTNSVVRDATKFLTDAEHAKQMKQGSSTRKHERRNAKTTLLLLAPPLLPSWKLHDDMGMQAICHVLLRLPKASSPLESSNDDPSSLLLFSGRVESFCKFWRAHADGQKGARRLGSLECTSSLLLFPCGSTDTYY